MFGSYLLEYCAQHLNHLCLKLTCDSVFVASINLDSISNADVKVKVCHLYSASSELPHF